MAKCVFCGEKADYGKTINIDTHELRCCDSCYEIYSGADKEDAARAVIDAGFYGYPWLLEEFLEKQAEKRIADYEKKVQRAEEYKQWREGREAGICPKCGGAMLKMHPVDFVTYGLWLPTINMSSLNTETLRFIPVTCEDCGYTEFYSPYRKKPADAEVPEESKEEKYDD